MVEGLGLAIMLLAALTIGGAHLAGMVCHLRYGAIGVSDQARAPADSEL